MNLFSKERQWVNTILRSTLSSICLKFNTETSWNHLAVWEIVVCFISEKCKLECLLLPLTEIKILHTRENKTNMVLAILRFYNISNHLVCFVYISTDLKYDGISYNALNHQLDCNGHIIHLVIFAFLFQIHPDIKT